MKNLQKKGTSLKEKGMGKNKFGEFLRKLLGGIREQTITTYDESGKIIEVATVTTRLSVLTIIHKLFLELMIVVILVSIFFNPIDFFGSILFLMLFIWLHSNLLEELDDDAVYMASLDEDND